MPQLVLDIILVIGGIVLLVLGAAVISRNFKQSKFDSLAQAILYWTLSVLCYLALWQSPGIPHQNP